MKEDEQNTAFVWKKQAAGVQRNAAVTVALLSLGA
jgi:hypothetical protein